MIESPWLTRSEAAAYCRLSAGTLANLANERKGPRFINPNASASGHGGRCLYNKAELDRWLSSDGAEAPAEESVFKRKRGRPIKVSSLRNAA